MEAPFHSGSTLRYSVMSDEQICIQRELCQSVSFAVRISTENDPLPAHFHSPCQRGKRAMNHAHCVHDHAGVAKHENRYGAGNNIMRLEFVVSFRTWLYELAQVTPSSVRFTEEIAHKLGRGGHKFVSHRAEYR